jgi:hypothetical protein
MLPKKLTRILTITLCLLLLLVPFFRCRQEPPTILYIPLDNRPVNYDFVHSLNEITPFTLLTPPKELLNTGEAATDPAPLWDWLRENAPSAQVMVLSLDSLLYGGLVPSRNHRIPPEVLQDRLDLIRDLSASSSAPILAFATVLRSEVSAASFGHPEYFSQYGDLLNRLSLYEDKADQGLLSPAEQDYLNSLPERIPADILTDHRLRRSLNHHMLKGALQLAAGGAISFLVLGRDDSAPFSHSRLETRRLTPLLADLGNRAATFPGADEIGMMLYTRAVNILNNHTPRVHTAYATPGGGELVPPYEDTTLAESLPHRLLALGATQTDPDESDLLLFINTPEQEFAEAAAQDITAQPTPYHRNLAAAISAAIADSRPAALADIACSNGADSALMRLLSREKLLPGLAAYAGWNTAGNSIGAALAHGLLYSYYHKKPGFSREAHLTCLQLRLLEDWGYQSHVRPRVQKDFGLDHGGAIIPPGKKDLVILAIKEGLAEFSGEYLHHSFEPAPDMGLVGLPWNRLFDLYLKIGP